MAIRISGKTVEAMLGGGRNVGDAVRSCDAETHRWRSAPGVGVAATPAVHRPRVSTRLTSVGIAFEDPESNNRSGPAGRSFSNEPR